MFLVTVAEELDATVGVSMDRFVYQNGLSKTFMAPMQQQQQQQHYYPLTATTAMMSARFGKMSKLTAEKKSHSEAESRRRKRINDHLFTLRSILPSKVKVSLITCFFRLKNSVNRLVLTYFDLIQLDSTSKLKNRIEKNKPV